MIDLDDFGFNITIVGLGLIGGSYAMALRKLNPKNLWAVDVDEISIQKAQDKGIIDKGFMDPREPLSKSDIVIMCVYPELIVKFMKDNIDFFKSGCLITDTAGTKDTLLDEIKEVLRKDLDFIGGHPMAGREYKGFDSATSDIFIGANYILTPIEINKSKNIELIENIIMAIGCKNIIKVTAKQHDRIMAHTSQLPHIMAAALMNGVEDDTHLFVAGSFRDATRVARLNGKLWAELMIDNYENTIEKLDDLKDYLDIVRELIDKKDHENLEILFDDARKKREDFLKRCVH